MNFNRKTTTSITIVAPKHYFDLARRTSHEISKQEGLSSTCWTIKEFIQNQKQISDEQHVILIGDSKENELTKEYLPIIRGKFPNNKAGVFLDHDGSKAIVYGEGDLKQVEEFSKLYTGIMTGQIEVKGENTNLNDIGSFIISAILLGFIGTGFMGIYKYVGKKKKIRKLQRAQTELALALFLMGGMNKWLRIKEEPVLSNE